MGRKKGTPTKTYTPEFKIMVVEHMRANNISFTDTAKYFDISSVSIVYQWERIYLEEGSEGLRIERRGGSNVGRKPNLDPKIEQDLISENQRLRMEIDYLKKLKSLVQKK